MEKHGGKTLGGASEMRNWGRLLSTGFADGKGQDKTHRIKEHIALCRGEAARNGAEKQAVLPGSGWQKVALFGKNAEL